MKKRLITVLLIGAFILSTLSACGNASQESTEATSPSAEIAEENDSQEETDEATEEKETEDESAKQEEAVAAYMAGYNCLYGEDGKEIDLEEAYTNFNHALELGMTEANFYLGVLCDEYNIPEKDYEKAKAYYEAAGDDSRAQIALGILYNGGKGVEQDEEKAQELFDAAIEQGDMGGYLGNAYIAYGKGDYTAAFENLSKVLEGTEQIFVAQAMSDIGTLYYYGQGVEQNYAQAIEWHIKAADLGNVSAMNELGYTYGIGEGVEADYTQALEWLKKAADLGNANAMNNLGDMYFYGKGVEQDYTQALEWFEKAADLGEANAMSWLGYLYENGLGVEQDLDIAQEWYNKAEGAQ